MGPLKKRQYYTRGNCTTHIRQNKSGICFKFFVPRGKIVIFATNTLYHTLWLRILIELLPSCISWQLRTVQFNKYRIYLSCLRVWLHVWASNGLNCMFYGVIYPKHHFHHHHHHYHGPCNTSTCANFKHRTCSYQHGQSFV